MITPKSRDNNIEMVTFASGAGPPPPPGGGGGPGRNAPIDRYSPPILRSRKRATTEDEGDEEREGENSAEARERKTRHRKYQKRSAEADGYYTPISAAKIQRQQSGSAKPSRHGMSLRNRASGIDKDRTNPRRPSEVDAFLHRTIQSPRGPRVSKRGGAQSRVGVGNRAEPSMPIASDGLRTRNSPNTRCAECARLHMKCDSAIPCTRCERRGVQCVRPSPVDPALRSALPANVAPAQQSSDYQVEYGTSEGRQVSSRDMMVAAHPKPMPNSRSAQIVVDEEQRLLRLHERLENERSQNPDRPSDPASQQLDWEAVIDPALQNQSNSSRNTNLLGFRDNNFALPIRTRITRPQTRPLRSQQPPPDSYVRFATAVLPGMPPLQRGERARKPVPTPGSIRASCDETLGPDWQRYRCGNTWQCRGCQNQTHDANHPHWVCEPCDESMKEGIDQLYWNDSMIRPSLCNRCAVLFRGKEDRGIVGNLCACESRIRNYRYCRPHLSEIPGAIKTRARQISDELARRPDIGWDGLLGCPFCEKPDDEGPYNINFSGNLLLCMGCDEIMTITNAPGY